jgi:GNAT superfamily N-acetyltransferase
MTPRRPTIKDVPALAQIVNDWIDATLWMPRDLPPEGIADLISKGLPQREMWMIGEPARAYISIEAEIAHIWGFYSAEPGQGFGKLLMDRAKEGRDFLSLNTHVPNVGAQKFYVREGFVPIGEIEQGPVSTVAGTPDRKPTGLRELRMEWRR